MISFVLFALLIGVLMLSWYTENPKRLNSGSNGDPNKLFKCTACNKMMREYQLELYKTKHGGLCCPHCEQPVLNSARIKGVIVCRLLPINNEDSWMSSHPDCMKLTNKEWKNMQKVIENIKTDKISNEELERFMEYNKLKVDSSWIENLYKGEHK